MSIHVKKRFDLEVTSPNQAYTREYELDKTITSVRGIAMTSDKDDLLYFRGSQSIHINKEEIFPSGYESKLLMCGINVSPHGRYYAFDHISPGNGVVQIAYHDSDDGRTEFVPYRVSLYLDCISE